jgi:hypothetical protein
MAGARGVALLAIALLLACAAPAAARTVFDAGPEPQYDDWRVVSGGLVQTDVEFEGPFDVTFTPKRGAARVLTQLRRVAHLSPPRDPDAHRSYREASFDAAADRVVLGVSTYNVHEGEGAGPDFYRPERSELWTTTIGGRAVKLHGCDRGDVGPVSTDGRSVAWVGTRCERDHTTIGVRDMSGEGDVLTLTAPPARAFGDVQVAGDHVLAWIYEPTDFPGSEVAPDELAVYSRSSGAELLRIPGAGGYDLQQDGKVTTLRGTQKPCGDEVAWHSPTEPHAHVLTPAACEGPVLIAGDRILWARELSATGYDTAVTDLAGAAAEQVFPPRDPPPAVDPALVAFHFDGRRVGYFATGCGRDSIVVDTVAELAAGGPVALETCTASLRAVPATARLSRLGAFVATVGCPRGCRYGEVRLWDRAARRHLALEEDGSKRTSVSLRRAERGGSRRVRLTLSATSRQRLRRAGRLAVELRVTLPQPDGPNRTYAKRLTLVAG